MLFMLKVVCERRLDIVINYINLRYVIITCLPIAIVIPMLRCMRVCLDFF